MLQVLKYLKDEKTGSDYIAEQEEKPTAGFIISLIAGILILINGLVMVVIGSVVALFCPWQV